MSCLTEGEVLPADQGHTGSDLPPVPRPPQVSPWASCVQWAQGTPDTSSHVHLPGVACGGAGGLPSWGCEGPGDLSSLVPLARFLLGGQELQPLEVGAAQMQSSHCCRPEGGAGGMGSPPKGPLLTGPLPGHPPGHQLHSWFPLRVLGQCQGQGQSDVRHLASLLGLRNQMLWNQERLTGLPTAECSFSWGNASCQETPANIKAVLCRDGFSF